jgi:hypothetical protein
MGLILLSFLCTLLFGFMAILALNYAMFIWEKNRVNDLASKIKPAETDILHKSSVSREFTSFDLRNAGKSSAKTAAAATQNIYEKTLVHLSKQEYPGWLTRFIHEFEQLRKNFFKSVLRLVRYLINLSKPAASEELSSEELIEQQQSKQNEIQETVERVKEVTKQGENYTRALPGNVFKESDSELAIVRSQTQDLTVNKEEETLKAEPKNGFATIGLAASPAVQDEKDMSLFEKVENRILNKLKLSGLNNYDIWLELGELYIKYGEKEKATEVFALVLKHTHDERQKELARNRLIGL